MTYITQQDRFSLVRETNDWVEVSVERSLIVVYFMLACFDAHPHASAGGDAERAPTFVLRFCALASAPLCMTSQEAHRQGNGLRHGSYLKRQRAASHASALLPDKT